jgi:hypothetical protein
MTIWRMRATLDDKPGFLALLTASLALKSVNILSVQVHKTEDGVVDEFLVDAPPQVTPADLIEALLRGRGRNPWVRRADARGLVDEPTRVLVLAARVAANPVELERCLIELLGDCEIVWRAEEGDGFAGGRMQLPDRRAARCWCAGWSRPSHRPSTPARTPCSPSRPARACRCRRPAVCRRGRPAVCRRRSPAASRCRSPAMARHSSSSSRDLP